MQSLVFPLDNIRPYQYLPASDRNRFILINVLLAVYVASFPLLHPILDHIYFPLSLIVVVIAGLLMGVTGGLYAAIAVIIAQMIMIFIALDFSPGQAFIRSAPLVQVLVGVTVGYLRDVRLEVKRQRDEITRQRDRLDEFASVVSHDLRNPLTVATLRTNLARSQGDPDHLEEVTDALDRMERIISQILILARKGDLANDPTDLYLTKVAEDAWNSVSTDGVELTVDVSGKVRANRDSLLHVFENLFRNAIEHGDPSTIRVLSNGGGFVVEDDGVGIPSEEHDRIFEWGYSGTESGTGLGLNVVSNVVESHGWRIDVAESEDGGARFEIITDSTSVTITE